MSDLPTVSIVFLVYNRREELRTSLEEMLVKSDYPSELIDVIVVDNASEDGSAEMVREEFPQVQLVVRDVNVGVSGWNDGFALVRGDYALVLDDDCYLPAGELRRAMTELRARDGDLISFGIARHTDPDHRFNEDYRTGLLSFWGCAVLMRREVLEVLGGYDPEIFVWANELEFMIRFFDHGFRHVHAPEIVAVHMKEGSGDPWQDYYVSRAYRINAEHFAYIAAKLLKPRDAAEAFVALVAHNIRDSLRIRRLAIRALPRTLEGFARGLRHRAPVDRAEVSRTYRRNFGSFASPWWYSRPLPALLVAPVRLAIGALRGRPPAKPPGRREDYYRQRDVYYPKSIAVLEM
jgi:GT2 family glycosyltransferase